MKRLLLFLFIFVIAQSCFAQFAKSVVLNTTVNFNIATKGLGTNDVGAGLGLGASFFANRRLQLLIEAGADRFIGDKLLVIDSITGKQAKNAAVYSIKAGPQFFVTNHLALSATYGPCWYTVREFSYAMTGGFRFNITGFLGAKRRFVANLFFAALPVKEQSIQYLGAGVGYRF